MMLTIKGNHHYLWRAIDQNADVLDILTLSRRNRQAAKRSFLKLIKDLSDAARFFIIDMLKS